MKSINIAVTLPKSMQGHINFLRFSLNHFGPPWKNNLQENCVFVSLSNQKDIIYLTDMY